MQRFRFKLEQVLRHKERRERLAEMRQWRALAALRTQEQALAKLQARWRNAGAALPSDPHAALDVARWLAQLRAAERLARDLAAATLRVHEAAVAFENATAQRRQQALEAEALRQLRHRQHERYLEQAAKAEQRFLDEEGMRRWRDSRAGAVQTEEGMP